MFQGYLPASDGALGADGRGLSFHGPVHLELALDTKMVEVEMFANKILICTEKQAHFKVDMKASAKCSP